MEEYGLPLIDAGRLQELLQGDVEECIREVTDAVNAGRPGSVIDDSEEPVRQAIAKFRQRVFEKATQMKMDAAEAAFSPSEERGDEGSLPS